MDEISVIVDAHSRPEALKMVEEIIDEKTVKLLTASGTINDCLAKVKEYVASGCTLPILCLEHGDYRELIDSFSEHYISD
jgi:hypothetical protein